MGCGTSQVAHRHNVPVRVDHLILETPEKNLIKSAPNKQMGTTEKISMWEKATEKPKSSEQGSFELPEEDFANGLLGVTTENEVELIKKKIGYGKLFIDPEFPPDDSSLFFNGDTDPNITWKRPHELVKIPKLFVRGVDRKDVVQGILGDCWFLSSCAAVAKQQSLIQRVIPPNQPLCGGGYKGLIYCRFWRFGEWVTVCIDDYLPVRDGQLIYAKCADPSEYWVALLEKAYAKLHGSYQALEGGQSMDGLVDLTGGLAERFDLEEDLSKTKIFAYLSKTLRNGSFVTCSRKGDWRNSHHTDKNGLVEGHAYSVTRVAKVYTDDMKATLLIRIRNPWGNEAEWKGDWSDGDQMWSKISREQKLKLMKGNKKDGEFWMSFEDFWKEFEEVSLCLIGPDFDNDGKVDQAGEVKAIRGEWIPGKSAGGSRNDFSKYATNPQFLLRVYPSMEGQDNTINEIDGYDDKKADTSHVLIGLMQEHRLSDRNKGIKMNQIGFCVYWTPEPEKRLPQAHFEHTYDTGNSGPYINYREVITRLELDPGSYVIIPATFDPEVSSSFMVRVYSSATFDLQSINS